MPPVLSAVDPLGRTAHLTVDRWEHIIDSHPYMAPYQADVPRAVRAPTEHMVQPRPGQDWFYLEDAGPARWLKVVVALTRSPGSVRMAFPRKRKP